MYKHILNLKKKVSPIVIEKVIFKNESLFSRTLRSVISIVVVFFIVWGVSKAQDVIESMVLPEIEPMTSFSLAGIVKEITPEKIVLTRAVGSSGTKNIFEIDIKTDQRVIETNTYEQITIADILVDDKIIIQGQRRDGVLYSQRIISFAPRFPDTVGINGVIEPEIAESEILEELVATTTDPIIEDIASTTDEVLSEATSTVETATTTESATTTDTVTPAESIETATTTDNTTSTALTTDETAVDTTTTDTGTSEVPADSTTVAPAEVPADSEAPSDTAPVDSNTDSASVDNGGTGESSSSESAPSSPSDSSGDSGSSADSNSGEAA